MELSRLAGNAPLKRQLSLETARRGLGHAYILSGPAGSGRHTLAGLLAAALVCTGGGEAPCLSCSGCKKALGNIHPDVIRAGGAGDELNVARVRAIRSDAYIRPNEAPRKVYILENAQDMNPSSQNALLKLLEEGPAYAAFLLLTDNAAALLATVRSRCQVLTLSLQEGQAVTAGQTVCTLKNDSLTNAVTNASLQLRSAQTSLAQLTDQLEDYTITAPADGIILSRTVKQGDLAAAGSPMAVLAQPEALCVHASIDEQYIDRVGTGQSVSITFTTDTGEERTYTGSVRRVEETGVTSGGVTDYTVEIALDNTEGLRDGMNVSVSILTEGKEDCLRLPVRAVDGDTVQVLRNGKAETVTVETGMVGSSYIEILSGLTEADEVILP